MRVMLVTTSLIVGGAENQVYLLAKQFRLRGHAVAIVSLTPPGAYIEELEKMGIEVNSLDMSHAVSDIMAVKRLTRLVREWRPDVVHAHMFHAIMLARLVRIGVRIPVLVSTTHNYSPESRLRSLLYRLTDRLGTITTNVSQAGTTQYIKMKAAPLQRIRAFPNGISIPEKKNDAAVRNRAREALGLNEHFTWLAVGRLEAPKDYPTLLRSFEVLVGLGSESRFLIVGAGNEAEALERQYSSMKGLRGRVQFLGSRHDVPDLMLACDGYVMSSSSEGLPLVLLEAFVARLPIVATDVGGNREIVTHGCNGFLVPPRNPEALAERMRNLEMLPPEDRKAMGTNGRNRIEEVFEIGDVAQRWLDLFEQWLAETIG